MELKLIPLLNNARDIPSPTSTSKLYFSDEKSKEE
jgi:hypothetical protein